jgi:hypothetical protein
MLSSYDPDYLLAHAVEAPPLPIDEAQKPKKPKEEMEDFLDDLLG